MENLMENTVNAELRSIEIVTTEIKTLCRQAQNMALMYAIEIGNRLHEAKAMLPHGEWGDWLKNGVNFSQSSANNFMRIADEYGSAQLSFFGPDANSQALGNLPYTKALKLLAIPSEEREEFVTNNHVEDISTRELDRIIKERDEAVARAAEAERQKAEEQIARSNIEKRLSEAESERQEVESRQAEVDKLKAELQKAVESERKAKERYKKLKDNPEIPQEKLDEIKKEAEGNAAAQIQEMINSANDKIAKHAEKQRIAEKEVERIQEELQRAKTEIKMANPEVQKFKVLFEQAQEIMNKLSDTLFSMKSHDKETAEKLEAALSAFASRYANKNQ